MEEMPVKVGDRILLAEYLGTVRYIGALENRPGEWVGVEWEDEFRGKHDGVVDSVRYFQTKNGEPTGSFLKASTFLEPMPMVKALKSRYRSLNAYDEEDMFVTTTTNQSKKIELVGLNKIENRQKQTQLLETANLSGACINCTGSLGELAKLLPGLGELNIAFNLIPDWKTVIDILSCLPQLSVLNLTGNRFLRSHETVDAPIQDNEAVLSGLRTLILNECETSWQQATAITAWFHSLSELQVCRNNMTTLSGKYGKGMQHLQVIDFSLNKIKDWNEICHLGTLPNLKKLNLTSNPLKCVAYKEEVENFFGSLESILLGDCAIEGWESVTALNRFSRLKETRLTGNPLMQHATAGGRFEIVARIGGLVHLNGSRVSPQERIDCERRYISHVANTLVINDSEKRSTILAQHPRYQELIAKHGEPTTNASVAKQTGALRESVIDIQLVCHAPSAGNKMGTKSKKVSLNMTFGMLKTLIEKLFTVPRDSLKLYLRAENEAFPEEITNVRDDKRLSDLYIVDGQQILVNE